jgi:hypothetical protein
MRLNRHLLVLMLAALLTVIPSQAASAASTWILVPVYGQQIPGAFGSLWSTEFRVFNAAAAPAHLATPCSGVDCRVYELPPNAESTPFDSRPIAGPHFLLVGRQALSDLTFQLRVYDESRSSLNWGTAVPVVEWESASGTEFRFIRVPASPPFRHTLRLYSFSPSGAPVRIRYYDRATGSVVAQREILVNNFAQAHSVDLPELLGVEDVRIEVVATSTSRVWAMVSITNDETQFVTILAGEDRRSANQ